MAYGEDIYKANHRDGGIYFSGDPGSEGLISSLLRFLPIEFATKRQCRSWVLDPAQIGSCQIAGVQAFSVGQGLKVGSTDDATHLDELLTGATKEGNFQLVTSGDATNDVVNMMGPNAFGPVADTVLRLYAKVKVEDVSACDFAFGLATDGAPGVGPGDYLVDTTGAPGSDLSDGIFFHRVDSAGVTSLTLSVYDGGVNTNSTQVLTLPTGILDDTFFEVGFIIEGLTTVRVFVKMAGVAQEITKFTQSSTVFNLLTSSLLRMGPMVAMRAAAAASEIITFAPGGLAVMQTY